MVINDDDGEAIDSLALLRGLLADYEAEGAAEDAARVRALIAEGEARLTTPKSYA